jgi:hypothetical protein
MQKGFNPEGKVQNYVRSLAFFSMVVDGWKLLLAA